MKPDSMQGPGVDDLVSAALLAVKKLIDGRSRRVQLCPRLIGHAIVVAVAIGGTVAAGSGAGVMDFDYASISVAANMPSAFSQRPSGAAEDVLVKPAEVVTQFVNRPRQGLVTHIVQQGETVGSIAEAYNVSVNTILWANDLPDEHAIQPGQKLVVLPVSGVLHEVTEGESVDDVAQKYQSDVDAIVDFNQITDPTNLVAGDKLVVPGGRLLPPVRMEASARTGERPAVDEAPVEEKKDQPLQVSTYRVQPGDNLGSIAERFGIDVETILNANDLSDPEMISPDDELTILPVDGIHYTVESGDSLYQVAEHFQADPDEIVWANVLADPENLQVGQQLVIPGGTMPPPVVVAEEPAEEPVSEPEPDVEPPAPSAPVAPPAPASPPPPAPAAPPAGGQGSNIVAAASKLLGTRYVWGGHSPSGFDCSGYTWYAYQQAGVYIPMHDLWGQLQAGPRIAQADLLPGDLVFFQNTYTAGLSHVGIYIGGGRFIHAASERQGVTVSGLGEGYWAARYFGASRPW